MAVCLHGRVEDAERGGMTCILFAGEGPLGVSGLTDWTLDILTASSPSYRTAAESKREQRNRRTNII